MDYKSLFNHILDGIIIADINTFKILDFNPSVTKILGYSKDELTGKHLMDIFSSKENNDDFAIQGEVIKSLRIRHSDKKRDIFVDLTINIIEEKEKSFFMINIRDVTNQIIKQEELENLKNTYSNLINKSNFMFSSDLMKQIIKQTKIYHKDKTVPVLIEGETGVGKEIIAQLIHYGSKNDLSTPFIPVNISAIPESLFESELFGYEKGSFTGADSKGKIGKFELAANGTIFLDEIETIPPNLQPKLLRILQEKEFYRIGGTKKIKLNARIICATNINLKKLIKNKTFRSDLYYRINVGNIKIPPLRKRKDDIIPLALFFLKKFSTEKNKNFNSIDTEPKKILCEYFWPGNVRELQNTIERVVLLNNDTSVKTEHLDFMNKNRKPKEKPDSTQLNLENIILPSEGLDIEKLEVQIVKKALELNNQNKTLTAKYLGLTRSALRSRISKIEDL